MDYLRITKPIAVGSIYRSPSESNFLEIISPRFNKLNTNNKEIYIRGNFNINFYLNNSYIFQKNSLLQSQPIFSDIKNTMNSVQYLTLKNYQKILRLSLLPVQPLLIMSLREKCPHSKFFWSVFSHVRTEYVISPYLVRMRKNADQKNYEYKHFSRSAYNQSLLITFHSKLSLMWGLLVTRLFNVWEKSAKSKIIQLIFMEKLSKN